MELVQFVLSLAYAESPVPLLLKKIWAFLKCINIAFLPNFAYEALRAILDILCSSGTGLSV